MSRARPFRRRPLGYPIGALSALLSALLLSACAGIPSTGPVVSGRQVDGHQQESIFLINPARPNPGDTAASIVSGFLSAAAGFAGDHEVARAFLTPQRRQTWRPETSVTIYPSDSAPKVKPIGRAKVAPTPAPTPSASSAPAQNAPSGSLAGELRPGPETTKFSVQTPVAAVLDVDGRYRQAAPGKTKTWTFTLIKVGGQWRISELDDGILLSANDFLVIFQPLSVYFSDPYGRYLVPDLHWFAGTRDEYGSPELPTALARVLLKGPPPWLKGAVISGAPAGTRLAVAAVVVSDRNVATVDLSKEVTGANTRQRQMLLSQLTWTLSQLSPIESVQITVKRVSLDVPPGSSTATDASEVAIQPATNPLVGAPVVIDAKGRIARLKLPSHQLETITDVVGLAVPGANRPAVSNDGTAYAVLNADRSKLLLALPGTKAVTVVRSAGLSAPSFDPLGWVWTAPAANKGFVYAAQSDSGPVKVKAPWLKHDQTVSLRISRDGTRAVVAVTYHGQAHLFLCGVIRDDRYRPESLTAPLALMPDLKTVTDVAWVDENHVVVLGRRGSQATEQPWVVQIGGTVDPVRAVPGAESITAGNGDQALLAGTAKGSQERSGALWEKVSSARWPAFPG